MGLIDGAKQWLVSVALKKGIQNAVKGGVGIILGVVSSQQIGYDNKVVEGVLSAVFIALIEVLRNWLKQKFPKLSFL